MNNLKYVQDETAKLLNLCDDEVRLPLVKIKKETQEEVKKALSSAKLIS